MYILARQRGTGDVFNWAAWWKGSVHRLTIWVPPARPCGRYGEAGASGGEMGSVRAGIDKW